MTRLHTGAAALTISDGRLTMDVEDVDAAVYFDTPDHTPLSINETHATLRITGDDYEASLELDAAAVDALADALYHVQEGDA